MTSYVTINNADIDQDSPVTQPLVTALRDNPISMFEGDSTAPKMKIGALERLNPGSAIRSRLDPAQSHSSINYFTEFQFAFAQAGTVRCTLNHWTNNATFASDVALVRTRDGVATTVATWSTTSTSGVARSADIGVLPGDLLEFRHKIANAAAQTTINAMRIQTNGENLWPNGPYRVEGNTFL